jgi:hypothetical protein
VCAEELRLRRWDLRFCRKSEWLPDQIDKRLRLKQRWRDQFGEGGSGVCLLKTPFVASSKDMGKYNGIAEKEQRSQTIPDESLPAFVMISNEQVYE